MWQYEHSIETAACPKAIQRLYSDLATWPEWDKGIAQVTLDGPFAAGTAGELTPAGQTPLPFRLLEVRPDGGFDDETAIPEMGIVLRFAHRLVVLADGRTRITHKVTIDGPAADTLGPRIGASMTTGIPDTMASLAGRALEMSRKDSDGRH